jgi:hypothetical protein
MKNHPLARVDLRNCICGRQPRLNHTATAGGHPDKFQVKAGTICFIVITAILYIVGWAVASLVLLLIIALTAALVKMARGHTFVCAVRDGFIIGVAFFANLLEVLNPANWF